MQYDAVDLMLIRSSATPGVTRRRTTVSAVAGTLVAAGLAWFHFGRPAPAVVFWCAFVYVVITTLEKVLHGFAITAYKRLVQKLVRELRGPDTKGPADAPAASSPDA